MTNAPAGWHPDPEDPSQLRYWDGTAWTEHRSPAGPGSPAGGYAAAPQSSGKATTALVLGVVSLIACGIFTGIPAMILGKQAAREIDASGGRLEGRGLATAGFVTGLIATILSVLVLLLVIGVFAIGSTAMESIEQGCDNVSPSPGVATESC